jgi:AcrR family transcriptional regulator
LREDGIDALSLRELARQAGVSHGAPRSHFADRQALLDALAERGFNRLADEVGAVVGSDAVDHKQRFRAAAAAYVHFAVTDTALLDLMFTTKNDNAPEGIREHCASKGLEVVRVENLNDQHPEDRRPGFSLVRFMIARPEAPDTDEWTLPQGLPPGSGKGPVKSRSARPKTA